MELFEHRFDETLFFNEFVSIAIDGDKLCGVCTFKPVQIETGKREFLSIVPPGDFEQGNFVYTLYSSLSTVFN
jgi:hypothetical protein